MHGRRQLALLAILGIAAAQTVVISEGTTATEVTVSPIPVPSEGVVTELLPCMAECAFPEIFPLPCDAIYGCLASSCTEEDLVSVTAIDYGGSVCPVSTDNTTVTILPTSSISPSIISTTAATNETFTTVQGTSTPVPTLTSTSTGGNTSGSPSSSSSPSNSPPAQGSPLPQDSDGDDDTSGGNSGDGNGAAEAYSGKFACIVAAASVLVGAVVL
ncbi:hypothetical protein AX16_010775 [Volvariella volvacea WC 439]|nr:hypothetical protein AX16_010775 [Volvariella volvacea WC 439]